MANKILNISNKTSSNKQSINDFTYADISILSYNDMSISSDFVINEDEILYTEEEGEPSNLEDENGEDISLTFAVPIKTYVKTNQVGKIKDAISVQNSLDNIFRWVPGERVINPEFGSNLRRMLYEGITNFNVEMIIAEIRHCVSEWEPRVQIIDIVDMTTPSEKDDNTVHIGIRYQIPSISDQTYIYSYLQKI